MSLDSPIKTLVPWEPEDIRPDYLCALSETLPMAQMTDTGPDSGITRSPASSRFWKVVLYVRAVIPFSLNGNNNHN